MKDSHAVRASGRLQMEAAGARIAALYERHARAVYGLCRLLLRDAHEAEDAAQATFLAAYRAIARGGEPRDPGAWLAAIARNECRGRIRDRMREPIFVDERALSMLEAPAVDPVGQITSPAVAQALASLPERQREAVVLHDAFGLRAREVAAALGVSLTATEALLFRARRQLRLRLRPVSGALSLPLGLRDALAQLIPGFADSGAVGGAAVGAAGAGLLAKLAGAPAAAKVAAATVAVSAAGSVVVVESERTGGVGAISARVATSGGDAESAPPGLIATGSIGGPGEVVGRSSRRSDSGGETDEGDADRAGPGGGNGSRGGSSESDRDEVTGSADAAGGGAGGGRGSEDDAEATSDGASSGTSGSPPGGSAPSDDDDSTSGGSGDGSGSSGPGSSSSGSGSSDELSELAELDELDELDEVEEPDESDEPDEESSGSGSGSGSDD